MSCGHARTDAGDQSVELSVRSAATQKDGVNRRETRMDIAAKFFHSDGLCYGYPDESSHNARQDSRYIFCRDSRIFTEWRNDGIARASRGRSSKDVVRI